MKLAIRALIKFVFGLLLVGVMLFIPAGGFNFTEAWIFIAILFIPILILGVVLLFKAPALLEKRLDSKEDEDTQKWVVAASGLMFVCGFIVAGLDHRFNWSNVPLPIVIAASAILLISYALYAEVMRENAYLSRKIEVQENQTVVDTGLYSVVRHPMYAVTVWLFLSIPVVLGSWWALLCFSPYLILIGVRIINEEKVLKAGLPGYGDYMKKVKYRLVPFIW